MRRTRSKTRKPFTARRGSVLVAALVCLAIVTLIMLSVFKTSLSQRRQIRLEEQQVQAELIAESGLERAVSRLRKDSGYTGEDWIIDAKQLDSTNAALAKIKVTKTNSQATIGVTVKFPKDSMKQNQATRSLVFELPTNEPAPKPADDNIKPDDTDPKDADPKSVNSKDTEPKPGKSDDEKEVSK